MALKQYELAGKTWQFEEGRQPEGATEVAAKARRPANKSRSPKADKAEAPAPAEAKADAGD
jgi:hypothetical protein